MKPTHINAWTVPRLNNKKGSVKIRFSPKHYGLHSPLSFKTTTLYLCTSLWKSPQCLLIEYTIWLSKVRGHWKLSKGDNHCVKNQKYCKTDILNIRTNSHNLFQGNLSVTRQNVSIESSRIKNRLFLKVTGMQFLS